MQAAPRLGRMVRRRLYRQSLAFLRLNIFRRCRQPSLCRLVDGKTQRSGASNPEGMGEARRFMANVELRSASVGTIVDCHERSKAPMAHSCCSSADAKRLRVRAHVVGQHAAEIGFDQHRLCRKPWTYPPVSSCGVRLSKSRLPMGPKRLSLRLRHCRWLPTMR